MTADQDAVLRNLTEPQPLDVEAETERLMFTTGIVQMLCTDSGRPNAITNEQAWDVFWRRIPFIKALAELGRAHPGELRALWKAALQESMPFGGAPLGLPKGEEP